MCSTPAKHSLRKRPGDVKIRPAFALAGSTNRALSVEFPASVSVDSLPMVSRAMTLGQFNQLVNYIHEIEPQGHLDLPMIYLNIVTLNIWMYIIIT